MYLRVWALDFSEFFMEAKHEGPVCSVDISADGRNIACGTLNGSLGVLNKSNQRYTTLLRSHTKSILSMDYHLQRKNLITVSSDSTIRLWDLNNFDQVVEYSSPIDQALCISAHPQLAIFACGFASGTMRVFDIEKTCVADNFTFTQFNKPIQAVAYSPNGDLLVTCCIDGGVALHNAHHQHLPTKMMNLEFQPEFVHVAFSPKITKQKINYFNKVNKIGELGMESEERDAYADPDQQSQSDDPSFLVQEAVTEVHDSLFAIMGEYGNNIMIYSSDSVILKHQINVGQVVKSFQFTKNCRELIVVTKDLRIRVYSLARFEGIYIRELHTVHRGSITTTDLSQNGGYMLTGGDDNLIKLWDYDAQKNVPAYYQAFIGHTFPLVKTLFNPHDNGMVITTAENDGIYIWQFHGDTKSNFYP
jgi:WD40 repeat protein